MPDNDEPDFGQTGKITIRTHETGIDDIDLASGEHLFYRVTAQGGVPRFVWACEHKTRRQAQDFPGHPKQIYEWTWCRGGAHEQDGNDDVYGVEMRFTAATKYTLVVEHRDSDDGRIKTLKDIDYESQTPEDFFVETLRVFLS
jgi:hypothetical protein